jgi:hypothetical protein
LTSPRFVEDSHSDVIPQREREVLHFCEVFTHPQQNGRHERMHLTLAKEATKPAALNFLQKHGALRRLHPDLQDLGFFDTEKGRVEPAPDPFVPGRLLRICPE